MTDRDVVLATLRDILRKHLKAPDLDLPEDGKLRDLAGDSLDLIEIVFAVEDAFGIDLPTERGGEGSQFSPAVGWTLADLVDWIIGQKSGAAAPPPAATAP